MKESQKTKSKIPASLHRAAIALAALGLAGIASAQRPNPYTWTLSPEDMFPSQDFDLKLLNLKYAGCDYTFEHPSAQVEGSGIRYTLKLTYKPIKGAAPCSPSSTPTGPTFRMKGLKMGTYAVMVWEQPGCYPACHVIPDFVGPVDTLTITTRPTNLSAPGSPQARADRSTVYLRTGPGGKQAGSAKEVLANGRAVAGPDLP